MIEASELSKRYDGTLAVDRVSFRIGPGEVVGYLGPNGAGKSTTVKMLVGMIAPSTGSARILGLDVLADALEVKRRIGYVPESAALYETLTGRETLELVGRLYHLEESIVRARGTELAACFDLADALDARVATYSKGMRRKLVLSAALLHDPEVLFLDEPLDGLDVTAQALLKSLLKRLSGAGKTIFYCSHILEVVERLCNRVIILDHGRVVADGSLEALRAKDEGSSLDETFRRLTGARDVDAQAARLEEVLRGRS